MREYNYVFFLNISKYKFNNNFGIKIIIKVKNLSIIATVNVYFNE